MKDFKRLKWNQMKNRQRILKWETRIVVKKANIQILYSFLMAG